MPEFGFTQGDILSPEEAAALFEEPASEEQEQQEHNDGEQEPSKKTPAGEQKHDETPAEEINPDELFEETSPESVGGEEQPEHKESTPSDKGNPPIFSSLAKALKEEGILLDLEDSEIEKVQKAEDFKDLMEKTIQSRFDERQKRIDDALNNGVEPSVIQQFENTIHQLDSITTEQLEGESEQSENLRKQILYRDYLNKGFSDERAKREVNKSVEDGNDIEDAKEALESIKEGVKAQYQAKLDEAKAQEDEVKAARAEEASTLRKSIMEDKNFFGELELDKATRQKALDVLIKPIYRDPKTGEKYTAIQKYEMDNRPEFLKNLGIVFALTDGFKNLDGLVKGKVKKEVGKGMKELEERINNTQRNGDGSLDFVAGTKDRDSFLSSFTLDV